MKDIIRMNQLAGLITEGQAKKMLEVLGENQLNENFTSDDIESIASSLDTEFKFSEETSKGRFNDLGINFILSPDNSQLILNVSPNSGYDDPQDFVDDIESEIGFPEYNFEVKGSKVFITKKSGLNENISSNPVDFLEKNGFVKIRNREEYLKVVPMLAQAGYSIVGGEFPTDPTPFDIGYGGNDSGYRGRRKERKNSIYLTRDEDPQYDDKKWLWFADVLDKNKVSDKFPIGTPYSLG